MVDQSLSCYARINEFGFIDRPTARSRAGVSSITRSSSTAGESEFKAGEIVERDKVEAVNEELKRRKVTFDPYCFYLSAWEEDRYVVAQANASLDEASRITTELVNCRQAGNFVLKQREEVDYIGRFAEATGLGCGELDSIPRKRRRQPRADGFQHAAPGRAADPRRSPAGRQHLALTDRGRQTRLAALVDARILLNA